MMTVMKASEKPETFTINGFTKLNHANTPALPNIVAAKINQGSGFFKKWNCSINLESDLSYSVGTQKIIDRITSASKAAIREKV
ncbi:hypothetical protein D3C87_2007980 [compost metagenome]